MSTPPPADTAANSAAPSPAVADMDVRLNAFKAQMQKQVDAAQQAAQDAGRANQAAQNAATAATAASTAPADAARAETAAQDKALDFLWRVYGAIAEWIRFADVKAGAALAANAALVAAGAAILEKQFDSLWAHGGFGWIIIFLVLGVAIVLLFSSLIALGCISPILAITDNENSACTGVHQSETQSGAEQPSWLARSFKKVDELLVNRFLFLTDRDRKGGSSLVYFGDISKKHSNKADEYAKAVIACVTTDVNTESTTARGVALEVAEQIVVNAVVATRKHEKIQIAVRLHGFALGAAFVTFILGTVVVKLPTGTPSPPEGAAQQALETTQKSLDAAKVLLTPKPMPPSPDAVKGTPAVPPAPTPLAAAKASVAPASPPSPAAKPTTAAAPAKKRKHKMSLAYVDPANPLGLPVYPALLITDIEGSSKVLTGTSPQKYKREFEDEINKRFKANKPENAYVVQDTGDGVVVAFHTVPDALRCAVGFQNALRDNAVEITLNSGEVVRASVRMTIHFARELMTPEHNDQVDRYHYKHPETVFAWRVMGLGCGGQILLTESARETLKKDTEFVKEVRDHKRRRIRDFEPQTLYEYLYDGVQDRRQPGQIAVPDWCLKEQNTYLEREDEEEKAIALFRTLASDGKPTRLVTVRAGGGMGKSRLANRLAVLLADVFEGGIYAAELPEVKGGPTEKAGALLSGLAEAVNRERGPATVKPELASLLAYFRSLGEKKALLVLHNGECVFGDGNNAATVLRDLLYGAESTSVGALNGFVLVTSRCPVGVAGIEQSVNLNGGISPATERGLFLQWARISRGNPAWNPAPAEEPLLAQIFAFTEGIPLAVELVAAHAKKGLKTLAASLPQKPLGAVTTLPANMVKGDPAERHQAMQNSLNWSYRRLFPGEQDALACLSLFPGTFAREAVDESFGWDPLESPFTGLIDASLVRDLTQAGGDERFGLHRFVREYAAMRFADLSEDDRAPHEQGFVRFWTDWMDANDYLQLNAAGNLEQDDRKLPALDREWRSVAAAQQIAWRRQMHGDCMAWLSNIGNFLDHKRAQWRDAETVWLCKRDAAQEAKDARTEARAWNGLASVYGSQGRLDEAVSAYRKCLAVVQKEGTENKELEAVALHGLAAALIDLNRLDEAADTFKVSIALSKGQGDKNGEASSWIGLGNVYRGQSRAFLRAGDPAQAGSKAEEAFQAFDHCLALKPTASATAAALYNKGFVHKDQQERAKAEACFRESVKLRRPLQNRRETALSLGMLGQMQLTQKNRDGLAALEEAVALLRQTEDTVNLQAAEEGLAEWREELGL